MDDPPNSRVFIVCGKSAEAEMLTEAFRKFGTIQSVKSVREKGVAYIKYDKASSAAAAIENMHEAVLNEGRGPMLKVMLAEAPKNGMSKRTISNGRSSELKAPPDPDNVPPLSRLFIVVPKTADGASIEAEMATFHDLQYCKTDLIASKGIVFCKYARSSSALRALETVSETGMLAGYKVKCMLAEPKGKRLRPESSGCSDPTSPAFQAATLQFDRSAYTASSFPGSSLNAGSLLANSGYPQSPSHSALSGGSEARASSLTSAWAPQYAQSASRRAAELSAARYSQGNLSSGFNPAAITSGYQGAEFGNVGGALGLDNLSHLAGLQAIAAIQGAANLAQAGTLSGLDLLAIGKQVGLGGLGGLGGLNPSTLNSFRNQMVGESTTPPAPSTPASHHAAGRGVPTSDSPPSDGLLATRLYVVVHKAATEEMLIQLFRMFPGLEYCDLKRDHTSGLSRGFAYVSYANPEAAMAAVEHLNGCEFPAGSGHRIKVMFAEPLNRSKLALVGQTASALSDSNDTILRHAAEEEEEEAPQSKRLDSQGSLTEVDHRVEVAAVQNSLSHLSMPQRPEEARGPSQAEPSDAPASLPALKGARRQVPASPAGSEKEWEAESTVAPPTAQEVAAGRSAQEAAGRTVFTILTRPLPSYALEHIFGRCGPVEAVRLQPQDERYGAVRFRSPEGARAALELLNGTDICGEGLAVLPTDPLLNVRHKRPRVAV